MMSVGAAWPLGNDWAMSSWPSIDSTESRNELPCVRPVEKFSRPSDMIASSTMPPAPIVRGRLATQSPTRRQAPWVSSTWCARALMRLSKGRKNLRSSDGPKNRRAATTSTMITAAIGAEPSVDRAIRQATIVNGMPRGPSPGTRLTRGAAIGS
jgi:hypothetical protein